MAGLPKQDIDTEEEDTDTSDPVHVLNEEEGDDEPEGHLHHQVVVNQQPPSVALQSVSNQKKNALDRFLMGYVEFMSSALYQDRGLKLLQWTLWLASKAYAKKSSGREALYKLSIDLSFARYALRLLGLPSAVEACRNDSWGSGWLGRTMAISMVGYYPLEHLAWAKWMVPNFFHSQQQQQRHTSSFFNHSAAKLSAWSCRCWFVYLMAELLDGLRNLQQLQAAKRKLFLTSEQQQQQQQPASEEQALSADDNSNNNINNNHNAQLAQITRSIRHQQLQVARDLLFTVPCIQWSLPNWDTQPWLEEWIINGLMWLESVVCMYQSVQAFNNSKK